MTNPLKTDVQIVYLHQGRRRAHAPMALVVEPKTGRVSQTDKGNLYVLIELDGGDPQDKQSLYRKLVEIIADTYYAASGDVVSALTEAIHAAHQHLQAFNQQHRTDMVGGVTALVVTGQDVISAQAGPTILAVRSRQGLQWFSPLNHEDYIALGEDAIPAVEIGRVPSHPGVVIVMMNSDWAGYLEVPLMLEATSVPKALAVADQMAGIGIDAEEELTALVITLVAMRAGGKAPVPPRETRPQPQVQHEKEAEPDWASIYDLPAAEAASAKKPSSAKGKAALAGIAGLKKRLPKPKVSKAPAKTSTKPAAVKKPRRLPYVMGIILILLLGVGAVTAGMWYYQMQQRQQLFEKFLVGATNQLEGAQRLEDIEQKRQALQFAEQQLSQARRINPDSPRIQQIEAQIRQYQAEINKVVGLMAGFDLPLIPFDAYPGADPNTVFVNGLSVYVLDPGRGVFERYQLDDATGDRLADDKPKVLLSTGDQVEGRVVGQLAHAIWAPAAGNRTVTSPLIMDQSTQLFGISEGLGPVNVALKENPQLQFVNGLYYYNGNIYLLDSVGQQFWRYRPSGSNYQNPAEPYFPPETTVNLKSVIDVGIDGYVWLLYPNGSMLKFLSGIQQPFALEQVAPPLTQAVALWVNAAEGELGRIFVADAATNRVLVFDKNGKLLAQLTPLEHAGVLDTLKDIYVDELTNTLYLLTETALYQSPIPNLQTAPPAQ